MSVLDDFDVLADKMDYEADQMLLNKFPIKKKFLGGYKHHGDNRVGYDAFGIPIRKGDWVIIRTKCQGGSRIDGLGLGIIERIDRSNVVVRRKAYRKYTYNSDLKGYVLTEGANLSTLDPRNVSKILDKHKFFEEMNKIE